MSLLAGRFDHECPSLIRIHPQLRRPELYPSDVVRAALKGLAEKILELGDAPLVLVQSSPVV